MVRLLLFTIALILFIVAFPIAIIYTALDTIFNLLGKLAVAIDSAGNVLLVELFNDSLISEEGHKFGDRKETISYVLGKNKKTNTLKRLGRLLCGLLNKIEKNHCEKAIEIHE